MFRLLIICITFLLLYWGFCVITTLDSPVILTLYNYQIKTTFFFGITFSVLFLTIAFIIIKLLVLILDLPSKLQKTFYNDDNYLLMGAMAALISNNKIKAANIAKKISPINNEKEFKDFNNLILTEIEEDITKKTTYLQNLYKSPEFKFYSAKNLALLYYHQGSYNEALHYATSAYNLNEFDSEILVTLIHCYGQLKLWAKMIFTVHKLTKFDKEKLTEMSEEISKYYLLAAENNTKDASYYLELALNLDYVNLKILEFYFTVNSNIDIKKKIKILNKAFNISPSLKIVAIFKKFTNLSDNQIYEEITAEFDTTENLTLLLAIATYLNLPDKIEDLINL